MIICIVGVNTIFHFSFRKKCHNNLTTISLLSCFKMQIRMQMVNLL